MQRFLSIRLSVSHILCGANAPPPPQCGYLVRYTSYLCHCQEVSRVFLPRFKRRRAVHRAKRCQTREWRETRLIVWVRIRSQNECLVTTPPHSSHRQANPASSRRKRRQPSSSAHEKRNKGGHHSSPRGCSRSLELIKQNESCFQLLFSARLYVVSQNHFSSPAILQHFLRVDTSQPLATPWLRR